MGKSGFVFIFLKVKEEIVGAFFFFSFTGLPMLKIIK
jgi:hypothetical protein